MGFVEATKTCLKKYVTFSGRASRSEFWYFYLFTILASILAIVIDTVLFGVTLDDTGGLEAIVSLALFVPTISAMVRRLHDTGRAAYYIFSPVAFFFVGIAVGFGLGLIAPGGAAILAGLIIVAGLILQLYWLVKASDPGTNKFGPNPFDGSSTEHLREVFE